MKARYKGANPPSAVRSMAELTLNTGLLILIFWVVVPTVDQYSDLGLVFRLYTGPEEDLMVSGGRCHYNFCYMQYFSITIPDFATNQPKTFQLTNQKNFDIF